MKKFKSILLAGIMLLTANAMQAQKTITVKTAEDFIKAIAPYRTIIIDSKQALDITSVLMHYIKCGLILELETYFYNGEEYHHELPDIDPDEVDNLMPVEYEEYQGDEGDMEEEAQERDIKMRELAGYSPENLKVEKYKAKKGDKRLKYVFYSSNTDGCGLEIRNCPGLTIKAKKAGSAVLLVRPRYVDVICFAKCNGLKLEGLTLGHTFEGTCDRGVLTLNSCEGVEINDCDLFGCGTEGFIFDYSKDINVNRSRVHDCSYHTLHITGCENVKFNECQFYRNRDFGQLNVYSSTGVNFLSCSFKDLKGELFNLQSKTNFVKCTFKNCKMQPITSSFANHGNAILQNCKSE